MHVVFGEPLPSLEGKLPDAFAKLLAGKMAIPQVNGRHQISKSTLLWLSRSICTTLIADVGTPNSLMGVLSQTAVLEQDVGQIVTTRLQVKISSICKGLGSRTISMAYLWTTG